jgi:hypothetical protein
MYKPPRYAFFVANLRQQRVLLARSDRQNQRGVPAGFVAGLDEIGDISGELCVHIAFLRNDVDEHSMFGRQNFDVSFK